MPASDLAALLVVTRGRVYFEMDGAGGPALELAPGDVAALPHGHPYSIRDAPGTPLRPFGELVSCGAVEREQANGGQTEFIAICCELAGGRGNPLLRVLPPLIHCPGSDSRVARWLEPTVRLLAMESGSSTPGRTMILNRLAEVVFVQMIRTWIDDLPQGRGGWLGALGDSHLSRALEAIHSDPGKPWSLGSLASQANMSRSAFATRFKSLVGETPIEYLTRWRMQRAATLLESSDAPLKEVVASSGYASQAAFRTMFKRWVGESPSSYVARVRGAPENGAA